MLTPRVTRVKQHPQSSRNGGGGGEKKRKYQQRVLDVEMGSFTPLVFGTNGGMGADYNCFLKRLAEKISEKHEEPYHITITWIRTMLSFEL